jgi:uncharacterized surface anchored protein
MSSTQLYLDRLVARLSPVALLGAALLAACNTDQPIAPKPIVVPTAAQPNIGPANSATLVIKVVDQNQNVISKPGAQFKLTKSGQASWSETDGGQDDSDPALGVIQLKGLAPADYQVCEIVAPFDYGLPTQACGSATISAYATATVAIVNLPIYRLRFGVTDFVPNYIGGMTFSWRDSTNNVIALFADNSPTDSDPAVGKVELKVAVEGSYKLCEETLPAGYVFPPAQQVFCLPFKAKHGAITQWGNFAIYPIASAYWQVTDGTIDINNFFNLIGPSTFKVTSAAGLGSFDVVDNGVNDIDPALGKIAVKLPVPGWYEICETVPPVNHWNASPSCKRIEAVTGVPAWAEWFINQEKQVFYPGPR